MKLLLCSTLLLLSLFLIPCHGDQPDKETLVSDNDEFRERLNKKEKPVFDCLSKLTAACASEMFGTIFWEGHITRGCCVQVLKGGLECYKTLVRHDLNNPMVKAKPEWGKSARHRANLVWEKCGLALQEPNRRAGEKISVK